MFNNWQINRILLSTGFILISILNLENSSNIAEGQELSVYLAYPVSYWIIFILLIDLFILSLLQKKSTQIGNLSRILSVFGILFAYFILLMQPLIRNYFLYGRGDIIYHTGQVMSILGNGFLLPENHYPIVHILMTIFNLFTNINITIISIIFFYILFLYFVAGSIILARKLSKNNWHGYLVVVFPLYLSYMYLTVHPSILSLYSSIYIFSLLMSYGEGMKNQCSKSFIILLTIFAIFLTICHPFTTIITVVFILCAFVTIYLLVHHIHLIQLNKNSKYILSILLYLMLVIVISFFLWYTSYAIFTRGLLTISDFLISFESSRPSIIESYATTANINLSVNQQIELVVVRYLPISMTILISLLYSIYSILQMRSMKMDLKHLIVIDLFLVSFLIGVLTLIFPLFEYDLIRNFRFCIILAVFCSMLAFINGPWSVFNVGLSRKVIFAIYIIIIINFSIFAPFGSPHTMTRNSQVSYGEESGIYWFLKNFDVELPQISINYGAIGRYLFLFNDLKKDYSNDEIEEITTMEGLLIGVNLPLDILESDLTNFTGYIILSDIDKVNPYVLPKNIRMRIPTYSKESLCRTINLNKIDSIYDNCNMHIHIIN